MNKNFTDKVYWVSSYPKSGNTWVRFLLINLLYGKQETSKYIDSLIPDVSSSSDLESLQKFISAANLKFMKSHLLLNDSHPCLDKTFASIYIIRNPIDVMLSNWNYFLLTAQDIEPSMLSEHSTELDSLFSRYIAHFLENKGFIQWQQLGMGNLEQNVESWINNNYDFPCLIVKYEDLLADTHLETRKICDFLELDVNETTINQAIINSSFTEMQKMEVREMKLNQTSFLNKDAWRRSHQHGIRFMSKGPNRKGKEMLNLQQLKRTKEVFLPLMEKLGYTWED
ncbi:MAG: sulfotransferase domain-containing protein [Moorea sp. SIO2B7]|nr:sulfotransferase domain-containing protein [Moorena sp. SIO2B7]